MIHTRDNKIIRRMLERLFQSLLNGPSLNCRPHSSRQRIDWTHLDRLQDVPSADALAKLLSGKRKLTLSARVPQPPKPQRAESAQNEATDSDGVMGSGDTPAERNRRVAERDWNEQRAVIQKLRAIADDARTYEQDTGVHVLNIGFPLLSLPPGSMGKRQPGSSRRIVAPIAFIPVNVTVKSGVAPSVEIACTGDGIDLVVPNTALLAWIEQQTGHRAEELFGDESGDAPWREICSLVAHVATAFKMSVPEEFQCAADSARANQQEDSATGTDGDAAADTSSEEAEENSDVNRVESGESFPIVALQSAPRSDDESGAVIVPAAVMGLYPLSNQGLLRDMQRFDAGEAVEGPIESFIHADACIDAIVADERESSDSVRSDGAPRVRRVFTNERLIAMADPCQSRAVQLARTSRGLVIHGPPGTGKSQTISNIIGDHLARGERVLVVCDKRTALDVVVNRLTAMGLGRMCAVVHDPQRDQNDLYRSIRDQLDELTDESVDAHATQKLASADAELARLHDELTEYHRSLSDSHAPGTASFHELVGQWFALGHATAVPVDSAQLQHVTVQALNVGESELRDLLQRGEASHYHANPWRQGCGTTLSTFLATPMDRVREAVANCVAAARSTDNTRHDAIPPLNADADLTQQAKSRAALADMLEQVRLHVRSEYRQHWSRRDASAGDAASQKISGSQALCKLFEAGSLDGELWLSVRDDIPTLRQLNENLGALAAYLSAMEKWYSFVLFGARRAAARVLTPFGVVVGKEEAQRVHAFLSALRARMVLSDLHQSVLIGHGSEPLMADEVLRDSLREHELLLTMLTAPELKQSESLRRSVAEALVNDDAGAAMIDGLRASVKRCESIEWLESCMRESGLCSAELVKSVRRAACDGHEVATTWMQLSNELPTLEHVLRVEAQMNVIAEEVRPAAKALLLAGVDAEAAFDCLNRAAIENAIQARLRDDKQLQGMDGHRIRTHFDRYRELESAKLLYVRDEVRRLWVSRQRERLLAGTGSRMNSMGAEMRRRLLLRGRRALRLRQVIALGESIEGGDPLFDLRPVWMASPETVAQLFPRKAMFDVVVFDEASQCRLEEALPVLTRAHRVVIAGDPRQLPPTRFFESAIAVSTDDEIESGQDLFEAQQSEVEDLLAAALNLDLQECYLDVHYRSQNADLIGFSNEQFYDSRLQPLPGHPSNRADYAPITMYKVGGVYENRTNPEEADAVCRIVRDLLRRADPPTIGIACFNVAQRDLISERLDAMATEDHDFARRLDAARRRVEDGALAHLFVKNLENVQGDERDHIIISTTYGPDRKGRFYQRFGPLGRVGGGRRLNVLVTRARVELHLVTSIPEEAYRALPPVPPGQIPGGGWLLFRFLQFAEHLKELYDIARAELAELDAQSHPPIVACPTRRPSMLAESLARHLADSKQQSSTVYWGNDGFCIDLALRHPQHSTDVTVGVLCDATRFDKADDPIEWDVFRTSVLEAQGWKLHRVWSPHFFRDVSGSIEHIMTDVKTLLDNEKPRDALPVER